MEEIGRILHRFLREVGIDQSLKRYEALMVWPRVVGEKIAAITEPQRVVNGRIFVKVKSATWRNELVFYKTEIIEKLNSELGSRIVKEIILT